MINNKVIIEKQETGKTTYLFNETKKNISNGKNIIILDSATEHQEKSLLKKIVSTYNNAVEINITDESLIDINNYSIEEYVKKYQNHFPYEELRKNYNQIICFDLSFFLEKGHELFDTYKDMQLYKYYRDLYNSLSQQIALIIILSERDNLLDDTIVITDEIEFPVVDYDMSLFQKNISFLSSVHPENAFGTFYGSFEKNKFKVYKKED